MPALPRGESGFPAENLGGHALQVDALGDSDVVGAVGRGNCVVVAEVGADAGAGRLLAGREVEFAGDGAGGDVERRLFPLELLLLEALLVVSCGDHVVVEVTQSVGW